jgi:hypothetical protein
MPIHNTTTESPENLILPEHEGNPDTLHIFVHLKTTRYWLDLPNEKRAAFFEGTVKPLLRKCPDVKIRFFEPEAFSTAATDILLCETKSLSTWAWFCDHLRDTLFWDHYFEVREILPALEGNYFDL